MGNPAEWISVWASWFWSYWPGLASGIKILVKRLHDFIAQQKPPFVVYVSNRWISLQSDIPNYLRVSLPHVLRESAVDPGFLGGEWRALILGGANLSFGSGGSKGGARDEPPWGSKFFQFHAVFGKIWQNRTYWRPHLETWCLLGEIPDPPLFGFGIYLHWQDPKEGREGRTLPPCPNSFNFMQFLRNFWKIICWHPSTGLAPPHWGNPGSATVLTHVLRETLFFKFIYGKWTYFV